ncbi:Adenylate cyclase type 9 [Polyrhizophydium stewartii]|uniref:adenylate cyclase n=1 Tax=Polyrhizophydium stewartii TaxID=2732419 RepID=A0ABR4N2U0_9FUNG
MIASVAEVPRNPHSGRVFPHDRQSRKSVGAGRHSNFTSVASASQFQTHVSQSPSFGTKQHTQLAIDVGYDSSNPANASGLSDSRDEIPFDEMLQQDNSLDWTQLVNPWTLHFKTRELENNYVCSTLLRQRVLFLRLLCLNVLCLTLANTQLYERQLSAVLWSIILVSALVYLVFTSFRRGAYYIWVATRSKWWYGLIQFLEFLSFILVGSIEFFYLDGVFDCIGTTTLFLVTLIAMSSGLSTTHIEAAVRMAGIYAIFAAKAVLVGIGASSNGTFVWSSLAIYIIPMLAITALMHNVSFSNDRIRRIGFLKRQFVDAQLRENTAERAKADYLLSVCLPKSIITKLKGQVNFDLIAHRHESATVMFGELKNFKDIAESVGSMKHTIVIINSLFEYIDESIGAYESLEKIKTISYKFLIVGGLGGSSKHMTQMIEMALALKTHYRAPRDVVVDAGITKRVDFQLGFGIAVGPLVACIVGKKKFVYEIYGDVVNMASRHLGIAAQNQIIVSDVVSQGISAEFDSESLGLVFVKGKGKVVLFNVTNRVGERTSTTDAPAGIQGKGGGGLSSKWKRVNLAKIIRDNPLAPAATKPPQPLSAGISGPAAAAFGGGPGIPTLHDRSPSSHLMRVPTSKLIAPQGSLAKHLADVAARLGSRESLEPPSPTAMACCISCDLCPRDLLLTHSMQRPSVVRDGDLSRLVIDSSSRRGSTASPPTQVDDVTSRNGSRNNLTTLPVYGGANATAQANAAYNNRKRFSMLVTTVIARSMSRYDRPGGAAPPAHTAPQQQALGAPQSNRLHGSQSGTDLKSLLLATRHNASAAHTDGGPSSTGNPPASDGSSAPRFAELDNMPECDEEGGQEGELNNSGTHGKHSGRLSSTAIPDSRRKSVNAAAGGSHTGSHAHLEQSGLTHSASGLHFSPSLNNMPHDVLGHITHSNALSAVVSPRSTIGRSSERRRSRGFSINQIHFFNKPDEPSGGGGNGDVSQASRQPEPRRGSIFSAKGFGLHRKTKRAVIMEDSENEDEEADDRGESSPSKAASAQPSVAFAPDTRAASGSAAASSKKPETKNSFDSDSDSNSDGLLSDAYGSIGDSVPKRLKSVVRASTMRASRVAPQGGVRAASATIDNDNADNDDAPSGSALKRQLTAREDAQLMQTSIEAREVVTDVVMRMCEKVEELGGSGNAEDTMRRYMKVIYTEMNMHTLQFLNNALEEQFICDFVTATWKVYMHSVAGILILQVLLVALGGVSLYVKSGGNLLSSPVAFAILVGCLGVTALVAVGSVLMALWAREVENPLTAFHVRFFHFIVLVVTIAVCAIAVTLPMIGLAEYEFMTGGTVPQLAAYSILRMQGMPFHFKTRAAALLGITLLVMQHLLGQTTGHITATVVFMSGILYICLIRSMRATRIEYLLDVIMETQSDLLWEEIEKCSKLLHIVLPETVITRLVDEPTSIVYEELESISVLFLDIVSFTVMSGDKEPIIIVEMLNTLFTFFDSVTDEYHVEKITTIGDAYVACSSFKNDLDPSLGAALMCMVALQMQAYVEQTFNSLSFVINNFPSRVSIRIGVNSGSCYAAIMGGPKNFRYNVLGDTVDLAERLQEVAPPGKVCISPSTRSLIIEDEAFVTTLHDRVTPAVTESYILELAPDDVFERLVANEMTAASTGNLRVPQPHQPQPPQIGDSTRRSSSGGSSASSEIDSAGSVGSGDAGTQAQDNQSRFRSRIGGPASGVAVLEPIPDAGSQSLDEVMPAHAGKRLVPAPKNAGLAIATNPVAVPSLSAPEPDSAAKETPTLSLMPATPLDMFSCSLNSVKFGLDQEPGIDASKSTSDAEPAGRNSLVAPERNSTSSDQSHISGPSETQDQGTPDLAQSVARQPRKTSSMTSVAAQAHVRRRSMQMLSQTTQPDQLARNTTAVGLGIVSSSMHQLTTTPRRGPFTPSLPAAADLSASMVGPQGLRPIGDDAAGSRSPTLLAGARAGSMQALRGASGGTRKLSRESRDALNSSMSAHPSAIAAAGTMSMTTINGIPGMARPLQAQAQGIQPSAQSSAQASPSLLGASAHTLSARRAPSMRVLSGGDGLVVPSLNVRRRPSTSGLLQNDA